MGETDESGACASREVSRRSGGKMPIRLDPHTESHLMNAIRRFFLEELDSDIGDLKASMVLDFFIREVCPSVYNQAIADAQESMERAVADLAGSRFEPEFDYWKPRGSDT